jgi:hypothetical protein
MLVLVVCLVVAVIILGVAVRRQHQESKRLLKRIGELAGEVAVLTRRIQGVDERVVNLEAGETPALDEAVQELEAVATTGPHRLVSDGDGLFVAPASLLPDRDDPFGRRSEDVTMYGNSIDKIEIEVEEPENSSPAEAPQNGAATSNVFLGLFTEATIHWQLPGQSA